VDENADASVGFASHGIESSIASCAATVSHNDRFRLPPREPHQPRRVTREQHCIPDPVWFCVTSYPPWTPATHQHAPSHPLTRLGALASYTGRYYTHVHACARHRQVLSNRRVLSIINVHRMRNRVQARQRTTQPPNPVPPPPPGGATIHGRRSFLLLPSSRPFSISPFLYSLSLSLLLFPYLRALISRTGTRRGVFMKIRSRVARPPVDYFPQPSTPSPPPLSFFRAFSTPRGPRVEGKNASASEGERDSHFSRRRLVPIRGKVRYGKVRLARGDGGGREEAEAQGGMIFSPRARAPELNCGRAMECTRQLLASIVITFPINGTAQDETRPRDCRRAASPATAVEHRDFGWAINDETAIDAT